MATSLKKFTSGELATALGITLRRGRPSAEVRDDLEYQVRDAISTGEVKVKKGKLVRV